MAKNNTLGAISPQNRIGITRLYVWSNMASRLADETLYRLLEKFLPLCCLSATQLVLAVTFLGDALYLLLAQIHCPIWAGCLAPCA